MIQVIILAPALAMRAGLRALLESEEQVHVAAEAARMAELESIPPADVIIAVAEAFSLEELSVLLENAEPAPALLLLSDDPAAAARLGSLPLRAWGILPSDMTEEELFSALAALHEGLVTASPALLRPLLGPAVLSPGETLVDELTPRELEVLALLSDGLANKQIAAVLQISEHTVKFHVSSIYTKLGVTNRAEAVRAAARLGLIVL